MNIFIIPSWYPSITDPFTGIFFREQALMLSNASDNIKIGISVWGQNDDRLLLWASNPLKNIQKILNRGKINPYKTNISPSVTEYFSPAFTWTWRIGHGNMKNIIRSCEANLLSFREDFDLPDIIHAHVGFPAGFIAKRLSEKYRIPYVVTEHMSPFPHVYFRNGRGGIVPRLKDAYTHSSLNIAVSPSLKGQMKQFGIQNIKMIPNPVDGDFFRPKIDNEFINPFTFFCLGRMVPQKGIDVLLKALACVLEKKEVHLRIGGDGEYLREYQKLANGLGINEYVTWLGNLNRNVCLREFQKCNIFVLASRHESMGIVVVEAMACGKPVISTRCGGPEFLINDTTGVLVPPENPEELARCMLEMIDNIQMYDSLKIREVFEDRFSASAVVRESVSVYQTIIEK